MISICIPVFNFDVRQLINTLSNQSNALGVKSEIVVIDDGSNEYYKNINRPACNKQVYVELENNIGRAAIRNRFLQYVKYDYLLFLDCDSIIFSENFLKGYIIVIKHNPNKLICGGRIYNATPPKRKYRLRWKYGIKIESKSHHNRNENLNWAFISNNFVVPKSIFETVKFDERLKEYGHEDTLFGFELKSRGIKVLHIDNCTLNGDLDVNDSYISSTEKAVANLIAILKFTNHDPAFIDYVKLLRIYHKLYRFRGVINFLFVCTKPIIKKILSVGYVSLRLFSFYKLGLLSIGLKEANSKETFPVC